MLIFFITFIFAAVNEDVLQKSEYYLEEIKNNNPTSQKKINFRSGLIQVVGNTPGIDLNGENTMPFVGAEWRHRLAGNFGLEIRGLYAQNVLYPPNNIRNEGDKAFYSADLGGTYIYEFDPTRKGNYFSLKLFYHQSTNNFEMIDSENQFLITQYSGPSFAIERGLTITEKIHLNASLDILLITSIEEESKQEAKDGGYGLFVRGEFHYLLDDRDSQIGLSYWQAAYTNEFESTSKVNTGKQNFVTTYRVISFSYSLLF